MLHISKAFTIVFRSIQQIEECGVCVTSVIMLMLAFSLPVQSLTNLLTSPFISYLVLVPPHCICCFEHTKAFCCHILLRAPIVSDSSVLTCFFMRGDFTLI